MNTEFLFESNAANDQKTVAYIIGNAFSDLATLPDVYTVNQFFSAALKRCLPEHRLWIVGQGIHVSVREILSLYESHYPTLHLHFGSLALNAAEERSQLHELFLQENFAKAHESETFEWRNFQFIESTRVKADLKLVNVSNDALLTHDFLLTAARELCEKACRFTVPNGKLLIKQAQLHCFHRFLPLPITVETQFQLTNDNKRSLKSLTRFYQDYSCIAEVTLSFDLYAEDEAKQLLQALGVKTFGHFSEKLEEEN